MINYDLKVYRNLVSYVAPTNVAGAYVIHTNQPLDFTQWSMAVEGYSDTPLQIFRIFMAGYRLFSSSSGYVWAIRGYSSNGYEGRLGDYNYAVYGKDNNYSGNYGYLGGSSNGAYAYNGIKTPGVEGSGTTPWGCLAYKTSGGSSYGGYFTSSTTGTGKSYQSGNTQINIGIGFWGDLFGADIHGNIYGTFTEGSHYGLFSNGHVFRNELDVHLQQNGDQTNTILFSHVSTDVTVQRILSPMEKGCILKTVSCMLENTHLLCRICQGKGKAIYRTRLPRLILCPLLCPIVPIVFNNGIKPLPARSVQ